MRLAYLAFPLALVFAASTASAQLKKAPSPAGAWEFSTVEMSDKCTISGEMVIVPNGAKSPKDFTCTFKAVQDCTGGLIRTIHTEQSCSADQTGSSVNIISRVDKIVSVKPEVLMKGMDKRYAPDNFKVTINVRGDEMDGMFESMGVAPVKFRRKQELVS